MAAKKKTTTKAATPKTTTPDLPTEFTIGGEAFRVTPKEEWTARQDDAAMAVMMRMSTKLDADAIEEGDSFAVVDSLIETGLYRRMLGIALQPIEGSRSVEENIKFFRDVKIDVGGFTPVMAVVAAFFGSGD